MFLLPTLPPIEEQALINGTLLRTVRQGQGLPVLLCHGGPGHYDDFEPAAAMVDDLAAVYRYDQRGCGRSARNGPYDLATYLTDMEGLREHWGLASWVVGGHSWGANLALAYALHYPARVRGLIYLCGTGLDDEWHEGYRANRWSRLSDSEQARFMQLRERLRSSEDLPPRDRKELDASYLQLIMWTDFADRQHVPPPNPAAPPPNYVANAALNKEWATFAQSVRPEQLAGLSCPTLFVHGAADPRPPVSAKRLAERIPGAEFVTLPDVGHYVHLERPERLKQVLRGFVRSLTR